MGWVRPLSHTMSQVISFEGYTPAARFDAIPWSEVQIGEGASVDGPFTLIDTIALSPLDADPSNPAIRNFTTPNASDTIGLWYQLTFADAGGHTLAPLFPVQNITSRPYYATVEELAAILKVNANTRRDALERVLQGAASEIDSEIGTVDINGTTTPYSTPPAIVVEVNLERAIEHWQQMQSPFGIVGIDAESGPTFVSRDTWDRHAHKLAPLKGSWGIG